MTSHGVEYEDVIRDWMTAFSELPEDRQAQLAGWFQIQRVIIENSGLSPDEWFRHVSWALEHPMDYSFIHDFPDDPKDGPEDARESTHQDDARKLIGSAAQKAAVGDGPGMRDKGTKEGVEKELFDRFMKERIGGGGGHRG